METITKRAIDFNRDIGLNGEGEPMGLIFIDFEPVPLLPTYSFVLNDKEIRYSLHRNPRSEKPIDRLNCFYLELLN